MSAHPPHTLPNTGDGFNQTTLALHFLAERMLPRIPRAPSLDPLPATSSQNNTVTISRKHIEIELSIFFQPLLNENILMEILAPHFSVSTAVDFYHAIQSYY